MEPLYATPNARPRSSYSRAALRTAGQLPGGTMESTALGDGLPAGYKPMHLTTGRKMSGKKGQATKKATHREPRARHSGKKYRDCPGTYASGRSRRRRELGSPLRSH